MPDTLAPESWRAPPIQSRELDAHYAEIRSFQAERADRATRRAQLGWASFIASMLVNILLAGALVMLIPLQRLIPMPLILESHGTWDAAATFSSLPPSQEEAVIRGAVWQYVKWRESYSWSAAQYAYDFVSLMSVPAVRDQYELVFADQQALAATDDRSQGSGRRRDDFDEPDQQGCLPGAISQDHSNVRSPGRGNYLDCHC